MTQTGPSTSNAATAWHRVANVAYRVALRITSRRSFESVRSVSSTQRSRKASETPSLKSTSAAAVRIVRNSSRVGFGFAYSAVARYARGRSTLPLEMSYTHLETITATGGLTPKYHRDQIEFRIYYRLRRGGR